MPKHLLFAAAFASSLFAQAPIRSVPLPTSLVQYLGLTPNQTTAAGDKYAQLLEFTLTKNQRAAQVQSEIGQETARETVDASALGVRYLELESIRREIAAEQQRTVTAVQALLTDAQRARLSVLQEALRLYSTACDAVAYNFITSPPIPVISFTGTTGGIASFLLGAPSCVSGGSSRLVTDAVFTPGTPTL